MESLYDYAWDDKHNDRHEGGRHDDKMPHGTKHNGKHDKDSEYHFQLVETDREFTYDENGRLLSSSEQEENSGLTTYNYTYDKVGNRLSYVKKTQTTKHPGKTDVAESAFYKYNDSNQLISAELFDGKKKTTVTYTYDGNGNLVSEIGAYGMGQVETYYDYTVENRLQAVYDAEELLMAAAYDGDGNRVFQLNYNLHADEDWKDNSGNGNGNNKDNAGSGNKGNGNGNSGNNSNSGNGNGDAGNNGSGNTGNNGNGNGNSGNGSSNSGNNGNDKENSKSEGTDDAGYGNTINAEEHNSQNQSGILFPIAEEVSQTETDLIAMIKTTGKEKDYELIEYINDVNVESSFYVQVLMELNENGAMDAAYTYGVSRLTEDRFTGESNFYLYDPSGNVAGITDQDGYLWQSYQYDAFGNPLFYCDPSGHDIDPIIVSGLAGNKEVHEAYDRWVSEGDKWAAEVFQGRHERVNGAMDKAYDWLGKYTPLDNDTVYGDISNNFTAGAAGSVYATVDMVVNPEFIVACCYNVVAHPLKTLDRVNINGADVLNGVLGVADMLRNGEYGSVARASGFAVGITVQIVIAKKGFEKCGELADKKKYGAGVEGGSNSTLALPSPQGTNPWMEGTEIISMPAPKDCYINMAMAPEQNKPGGWGTFDSIPDVDYVRNKLAVTPEFKPEVSDVQRFLIPEGTQIQIGIVGPQKYNNTIYKGGGNQIQILNFEDRATLIPIGPKKKIY